MSYNWGDFLTVSLLRQRGLEARKINDRHIGQIYMGRSTQPFYYYYRAEQFTFDNPQHTDVNTATVRSRGWAEHSSFTPNLKHCSSVNPILIHLLLPTSLPSQFQTPSTIAVWLFCLPDSLDLTLPIDFVLDKRLWKSWWFPWPRFCGRCRNLEFTTTIRPPIWN